MDNRLNNITGVILAGGKSERMGTDKALVLYKGRKLIDYSIEFLKTFTDNILISSNGLNNALSGFEVIPDAINNIGPIGGLYTVLKYIKTRRIFVVPCDMPYFSLELAKQMFNIEDKYDCIIPKMPDGKLHPLFAIYSCSVLPLIEKSIHDKNYKLQSIIEQSNAYYILPDKNIIDENLFRNINTPDDVEN